MDHPHSRAIGSFRRRPRLESARQVDDNKRASAARGNDERDAMMSVILESDHITASVAIGAVGLIAGAVHFYRSKMLLGVAPAIIGILRGLSTFGVFE
jgi:hypothetical protein